MHSGARLSHALGLDLRRERRAHDAAKPSRQSNVSQDGIQPIGATVPNPSNACKSREALSGTRTLDPLLTISAQTVARGFRWPRIPLKPAAFGLAGCGWLRALVDIALTSRRWPEPSALGHGTRLLLEGRLHFSMQDGALSSATAEITIPGVQ